MTQKKADLCCVAVDSDVTVLETVSSWLLQIHTGRGGLACVGVLPEILQVCENVITIKLRELPGRL